eukprot:scaffold31849_cov303-Skeletonema_menzelii.AAC.1
MDPRMVCVNTSNRKRGLLLKKIGHHLMIGERTAGVLTRMYHVFRYQPIKGRVQRSHEGWRNFNVVQHNMKKMVAILALVL